MTCGWTGVCRPVSRKLPSSNYRQLPSYPLLWWILAENYPFLTIFCQFLENPPLFKENLPKKGPLFREFWTQKPTHMGGTYPYPQHVMYPPRGCRINFLKILHSSRFSEIFCPGGYVVLTLNLPFLCHKSATTCQIDSNKVSNSKLKLDLYNCVNTEITESIAPPQ